ncbi:MAG: hypothetical protein ACFCUI_02285 [Bernardetiaceae bacterium]
MAVRYSQTQLIQEAKAKLALLEEDILYFLERDPKLFHKDFLINLKNAICIAEELQNLDDTWNATQAQHAQQVAHHIQHGRQLYSQLKKTLQGRTHPFPFTHYRKAISSQERFCLFLEAISHILATRQAELIQWGFAASQQQAFQQATLALRQALQARTRTQAQYAEQFARRKTAQGQLRHALEQIRRTGQSIHRHKNPDRYQQYLLSY